MSDAAIGPAVDLDPIVTGELPIPHAYVFRPEGGNRLTRLAAVLRPGAEVIRCPCLAYVARHPAAGTLLIDTGFHPDTSENLRKDFGALMAMVFRGLRPDELPFDARLRALGVEPGEVERVVMTHLHVDHTSGMRLLPNAGFICARREWAAARRRHASRSGYAAHHLPPESRVELVDFDANGESHGPFSKTIDLLGDGSVRLLSTPGHTPGHLSVLLRVGGGRQVLVVGDAAYTTRSIREEVLPLLTVDDGSYLSSLCELKSFAEQEPDAVLVPTHDPTAWQELPAAPAQAARGGRG